MFQDFYAGSELLIWPLLGLIIFVSIFVGVLAYVFLGLRDRERIDSIAALPLEADTGTDSTVTSQATGRAG